MSDTGHRQCGRGRLVGLFSACIMRRTFKSDTGRCSVLSLRLTFLRDARVIPCRLVSFNNCRLVVVSGSPQALPFTIFGGGAIFAWTVSQRLVMTELVSVCSFIYDVRTDRLVCRNGVELRLMVVGILKSLSSSGGPS